jgi:hypothetical protein
VKKPQFITAALAVFLVFVLFKYGKTILKNNPEKQNLEFADSNQSISFDSLLAEAKKKLSDNQVMKLEALENSLLKTRVKQEQLNIYHQLAHYWSDSAGIFEPFAWYEAEAARLENSEKTCRQMKCFKEDNGRPCKPKTYSKDLCKLIPSMIPPL